MEHGEEHLLAMCRAGRKEAFGELVRRYAGRAIGHAALLLRDRDEAMDASQDAFAKAWRAIGRFKGDCAFFTWYSTILRNVCRSRLRKRAAPIPSGLELEPAAVNESSDPAVLAQKSEQAHRLWQAILRLPDARREILVLYHFQDMPYREIAKELDIPIGTVMSRLHAARKALRDMLQGDHP